MLKWLVVELVLDDGCSRCPHAIASRRKDSLENNFNIVMLWF
jgi:hypothetical protein